MSLYNITAWKYPAFYATDEIEAENADAALEAAKIHYWNDAAFEDCGDWGAPPRCLQATNAEDDGDTKFVDLEPDQVPKLKEALRNARAQLISLGGDPRGSDPDFGDRVQAAVLNEIDEVLK